MAPLEALPDLGNSLPRGPGTEGETNPGTATSDNKTPRPSSTSGEGNGRVYRVQVGRFTDEADAKRLRDELAAPGSEPQVVKSERDGVVVYRVQVGTYRQEENAKRQLESLRAKSYEPYLAEDDK